MFILFPLCLLRSSASFHASSAFIPPNPLLVPGPEEGAETTLNSKNENTNRRMALSDVDRRGKVALALLLLAPPLFPQV